MNLGISLYLVQVFHLRSNSIFPVPGNAEDAIHLKWQGVMQGHRS